MQSSAIIRLAILVILVFCTMATGLNSILASAQSRCDWVEYGDNPVFGQWLGDAKAYYPKVLYDPGHFSGHGDNAFYKMWFGSSSGIGYAYSDNGTSWTAGQNPLPGLVTGANHPLVKYDPGGFGQGVYYKMWYWTGIMDYNINNLHYAESTDGVIWEHDQPLTQDGTYPLVTNNPGVDWNAGSYGPCDLIYNQGGLNLPWNNKYVMYYMGTTGGNEFIFLAYSDNGTHWTRFGNAPVLSPCTEDNDPSACWDYYSVGYCSVINLSSGNWQMWYGGGPGTNLGIGYATSPDGITWTKHSDNPIFHVSDGIPWSDNRTYTPWVVYDAAGFSGYGDACPYKMWFSGKSTTGEYSVGYACALPVVADAGPDRTIMPGGSTLIGGSPTASGGIPPYTYIWTPTTGLNDSTLANPTASPTTTTTYTITVTDSKDCTSSDNMTLYVQPAPTPSGGGGLPASFYACPVTLAADIQGNIATVRMTKDGVLCKACLAKDAADKDTLELDKDTKVMLADNTVPVLLRLSEASVTPPAPENTAIVGLVYELNAYSSTLATTPSPITISPSAKLLLTYNPDELPKNTSEVFIATYDTEKSWQPLEPVPGTVAEIGKVHGLVSHFSLFAVLAKLEEPAPAPAKFEVSNLAISPPKVQPNQEVTISIDVTNTGGKSGDYSLELKVDGTIQSSKQITVAAGSSQRANFTTTSYAAGKHQVKVASLVGEFEVIKSAGPSVINWWLMGGITVLVLAIWSILGWRWFKGRKKAKATSH